MNRVPLDDYLASLPFRAGYALTSKHLVVVPLDAAGIPQVMAAFEWNSGRTMDDEARFVTRHLAPPLIREVPDVLLIIGYGPQGAARATALGQAFIGSAAPTPGLLLVHIDDEHVRTSHTAGRQWEPSRRLPAPVSAVAEGLPAPAVDRAAVAARYAPLETPTAVAVSHSQAVQLAMTSPALRAEILTRAIDHLSVPRQGEDTVKLGLVAHLIGTDVLMRDVAIAHAGQALVKADALVRTFRAAPLAQGAQLATAAAAATYLAAGTPVAVEALLSHADATDRDGQLAQLVRLAQVGGFPPAQIRRALVGGVTESVAQAEEAWQATADRPARSPDRAEPARRAVARATGPGHQLHRPRGGEAPRR